MELRPRHVERSSAVKALAIAGQTVTSSVQQRMNVPTSFRDVREGANGEIRLTFGEAISEDEELVGSAT